MRLGRRTVINRIRRVANDLGRAPKIEELVALTEVRRRDVANNFTSYSEALIVAGLMKTREMLIRERKIRGYIPPWNYNGGETKMSDSDRREWKLLASELVAIIGVCEVAEFYPDLECAGRLIANHIIPRRVGGPVLDSYNVDIMCDRHHKLHKPDLYWFQPEHIDFNDLFPYQLERLIAGAIISEEDLIQG